MQTDYRTQPIPGQQSIQQSSPRVVTRADVREALASAEVAHLLEYKQVIDARLTSAKAVLQSQLAAIEKGTPVKAPRAPRSRMNMGSAPEPIGDAQATPEPKIATETSDGEY